MASRRRFIRNISLLGLMTQWRLDLEALDKKIYKQATIDWAEIRAQFPIAQWDKIQLNSGSAGVMSIPVRDNLIQLITYINTKAPYHVWAEWQDIKQETLARLANMTGVTSTELQIVRNTTEALNMIIYGLHLHKGDEVIIADHDYPFTRNAWLNRSKRAGIILKEADIVLPASDEEILAAYRAQITKHTRVIHVTHLTHREGHIMPVQRICEMAHQNGIECVVDGAHVIGQIPVNLSELGCDYFASSLHKWLNAPLGTGFLYVTANKIETLYNHPSSNLDALGKMEKYEHIGTRAWANEIGISAALDFHEMIGQEQKTQRLQELKEYWMNAVEDVDRVSFHTDKSPLKSAAVSTFSMKDMPAGKIRQILDKEFNIYTKSVGGEWGSGIRISPNIFTNFSELDQLTTAIKTIANRV